MLIALAIFAIVIVLAKTIRHAFGRGFLLSGAAFLLLPLTSSLLGGVVANEVIQEAATASEAEQAGAVIGATLGAGLFAGAASIVGIILGVIFIVFGIVLLLGGRREVIVVERRD